MMRLMLFLMFIFFLKTVAFAAPNTTLQVKQDLRFADECSSGPEVTISGVGDILLHGPLQVQAFREPDNYRSLWPAMIPVFHRFDLSYANFEGPAAEGLKLNGQRVSKPGMVWDPAVYTSYPQFNYHPILVRDVLQSGIDVVSTANNHSLDRKAYGADLTIQAMLHYGLKFTGTRTRDRSVNQWHTTTNTKDFKIAWLACTFSTNGIPDVDSQVLPCFENKQNLLQIVSQLSQESNISAVIVTPHWGEEYTHAPNSKQIRLGRELIEAGATAVIATHPHVIQPWEKYTTSSGREGLIVYSTGNFVSAQTQMPRRVGLMVALKLIQDQRSRKLNIKTARFLPLLVNVGRYSVAPVAMDSQVSKEVSTIWNNLYHPNNRVTDLQNPFVGECRQ